MEAVNGGSLGEDKGGPPPPSPLTGCYLLVVIGEPHSEEHKNIILQKVAKGLLSWDVNECLVDLEKELAIITDQGLEGEEARYGERLIQFASENLVTEILIHPAVSTLSQCIRNLLSSFTRHRHIIHAGYTFQGNGSWALQDGTFSYSDFAEAFQEIEVQRVIHAYENGISIDLHCTPEGDWTRLPKEYFTKSCKVRVNPTDVLTTGSPSISSFTKYLEPFLVPTVLEDILESSDVVGNIRFSRPTLYVFPGGQGDAALFGINGFNMLLDGGYSRKACFWDFVRHLDRLDAVLMTRLNNSSVSGVSSVLKRKKQGAVYPQLGHFFSNIHERKSLLSPDGDKDKDPLIISLIEEGQNIIQDLRSLNLSPQSCYRESDPIILYHKVGHGTLNMYVLSPDKNSREVRDFLQKWNQCDSKLFSVAKVGKDFTFPLQNLVSICALLVWQPANPEDTITRILYPGSTPQKKIFEGLDRLKNLEYMKHPVCTVKSIAPVKKSKQDIIDKLTTKETKVISEKKAENKTLIEESMKNAEMNGDVINRERQVKKSDSLESDKEKKTKKIEEVKKVEESKKNEKTEITGKIVENGEKPKPKSRPAEPKPKLKEGQQKKKTTPIEKKGPPTPKKIAENKTNGDVKEREKKLVQKPSPTATPAKSTKDANNRKVIESKRTPPKKEAVSKQTPIESKPKAERKPISRRPKTAKGPPSPMKKMANGVQKPDSLSKRGKLDKEGTTDSSTVSTPSADQESILKKDISKLTPEEIQQLKEKELEELKEEQDAIKEIEAVFRKGEAHVEESEPGVRKIKEISIDDNLDTEEYLIIEKEEIEHDSLDQEAKEDEMQKLVRDSEESEKQRKLSAEEEDIKDKMQEKKPSQVEEPASTTKVSEDLDSKKPQAVSPEEKALSATDKKEVVEEEVKEVVESHPEEKVSANVESGATTTAPTLPEDERITLDEIKEDNGQAIEEKHVKEETKEKEVPIIQLPPKSQQDSQSKQPPVVGIPLDKQKHVRDIVKTPDEVADLPVHEEADYHEFDADEKKTNEVDAQKHQDKDDKKGLHKKDEKETISAKKGDAKDIAKKTDDIVHVEPENDAHQDQKDAEVAVAEVKQIESDIKIKDSVIETVGVTADEAEKSDILEKADVETKEKSDQDKNHLREDKLKESIDDEWVVITKEEEKTPEVALKADKIVTEKLEDLKHEKIVGEERALVETEDLKHVLKDKIVSDFIAKEVEQEFSQRKEEEKQKESEITESKIPEEKGKDIDTESDHISHEIRKEDEIEEVIEKDKEDIKALIEEADKKTFDDEVINEKLTQEEPIIIDEKVIAIKESKQEIAEIDNKLQELKKEVITPVEELHFDKVKKDMTKVDEHTEIDIKQDLKELTKIDNKLNDLKHIKDAHIAGKDEIKVEKSTRSPEHAESVILSDSSPEEDGPRILKDLDIDKSELGRKSPAEREEDVKKIVVSVAEVLKSEAPLEEFQGKLSFTQELRETHITTQDSPILEAKIIKTDDIPPIPEEPLEEAKSVAKETALPARKDSVANEDDQLEKEDEEATIVHRMLVTASSEDGGEEIEICPPGTITFSRSSESSGRSSPEPSQKTQSQKSSIVETLSDTLSTVKQLTEKSTEVSQKDSSQVTKELEQVEGEPLESKEARGMTDTRKETKDVVEDKHDDFVKQPTDEINKDKKNIVDDIIKSPDTKKVAEITSKEDGKTGHLTEKPDDLSKKEETEIGAKQLVNEVEEHVEQKTKEELHSKPSGMDPITKDIIEKPVEISSKLGDKKEENAHKEASTIKEEISEAKVADIKKDIGDLSHTAKEPVEKAVEEKPTQHTDVTSQDSIKTNEETVEKLAELKAETKEIDTTDQEIVIKQSDTSVQKDLSEDKKEIVEKSSELTKIETKVDPAGLKETVKEIVEKPIEIDSKLEEKSTSPIDKIVPDNSTIEKPIEVTQTGVKEGETKEDHIELTASTEDISDISKKTAEPLSSELKQESKSHDEQITETKPSHDENIDNEKPPLQRRESIIEKAQEFLEKSEEALEDVLASIGTKVHSVFDEIIKTEPESKETGDVTKSGKSSPEVYPEKQKDDREPSPTTQIDSAATEDKQKEDKQEAVKDDTSERRGSIIEVAEEFIEKSEKALESVFSSIGGAAKIVLHDILPEEQVKPEESKAGNDNETKVDQTTQDKKEIEEVDKAEKKATPDEITSKDAQPDIEKIKDTSDPKLTDAKEEQPKSEDVKTDIHEKDSLERRGSIIEVAEDFIEKSEKSLESVFTAIGGAAKSVLHDILPEEKEQAVTVTAEKTDQEIKEEKQAVEGIDKSTEKIPLEAAKPEKSHLEDEKEKKLVEVKEHDSKKAESKASENEKDTLIETESFIEKSEKTIESIFSAIGGAATSVIHDIFPEDKTDVSKPSTEKKDVETEKSKKLEKEVSKDTEKVVLDDDKTKDDKIILESTESVLENESKEDKPTPSLERRSSIVETTEEFIEKSEKALESVFSAIGDAAKSVFHDILPEGKLETDEHSELKADDVVDSKTEKAKISEKEISKAVDLPVDEKQLDKDEKKDTEYHVSATSEVVEKQIDNKEKHILEKTTDGVIEKDIKTKKDEPVNKKEEHKKSEDVEKSKDAISTETDKLANEFKVDKDSIEKEKKQVDEEVDLSKSVQPTGECKIDKKSIEKVEQKGNEQRESVSGSSTKSTPTEKEEKKTDVPLEEQNECKIDKETIRKEEEQIEKEVDELRKSYEDLSKIAESVSFEKCHPDEFKVDTETIAKEEKQIENEVTYISENLKEITHLVNDIPFEKCHPSEAIKSHTEEKTTQKPPTDFEESKADKDAAEKEKKQADEKRDETKIDQEHIDEFKVDKTTIQKEEKEIDDKVMHVSETVEKLSDLAKSVSFEKCHPAEEFKVDEELKEKEEKQIDNQVSHIKESFDDLSKLTKTVSFDKCKSVDEYKVEKEIIEKDEQQIEEEVDQLNRSYEDLSKLTESVAFDKCKPTDEYKVDKETLEKEEKQIEEEVVQLRQSYEDLSKLTESVSFDKCKGVDEYKVDKDALEKDEKQIDAEVDHLRKSCEDLSKLTESVSFDKCKDNDEYKVDKDIIEKDEKQIEAQVDQLKKSYEDLSKLTKSVSFDKCKDVNEYFLNLQKDEKQIEEEVDELRKSYEDLTKLAESVSFDKCKSTDEYKVDKDILKKSEKHMDEVVDELRKSYDDLSKLTDAIVFEKCERPHESTVPKPIVDSNKIEHLSRDEKKDKEKVETAVSSSPKSSPAKDTEDKKVSKETVVLDEQPKSSQTEKCEKESMEKTSLDKDISLKVNQTEHKKISISDVEISIKTDIDHKDASRSFLDNERSVLCDSTDAKVYKSPTGDLASQDGSSIASAQTSAEAEVSSDKSSPDMELSGKTTPPTVPISPIAKDIKSPSSKLDSGLSEQTETDDEDLSTKSQVAHSQSDLDELDMKMDPMSMSIYGALPEEQLQEGEQVPGTYLYEITKAKYTADIKPEDDEATVKQAEMSVMTASFIGNIPSTSAEASETKGSETKKDAVDSWGKPLGLPAPTYLYEVTKAKFSSQSEEVDLMTASFIGEELPTSSRTQQEQDPMTTSVYFGDGSDSSYDPIASWGKPLGLPSPAPPNNNEKGTPKKERKLPAYVSAKNKLNDDKRRAESPSKLRAKKVNAVYVDLTYVPHHGNHYYSYVDFFRRIRARYYVFSGLEPSRQVYDALLEAKQTWEDKELEVTIIPTYDTDILGYWVAENEELLSKFKVDLAPSASRCTINLQDHETSCSAYRLEF